MSFPVRQTIDVHIAVSRLNKTVWMKQASEIDRSLVSTIVSELGTNIIKYADYGFLHVEFKGDVEDAWVEIRAEDDGPGIADVALALRDHFTTGNTLGLGLPGVRRMADSFKISSAPGQGTQVIAAKGLAGRSPKKKRPWLNEEQLNALPHEPATKPASKASSWEVGTYTRPMPGQVRGGDLAMLIEGDQSLLMVMVDATGHGERASQISNRIRALVPCLADLPQAKLMQSLHHNLTGTIGAAIGLFRIDLAHARFSYLGVGNTGIARATGEKWRGISRDGLVGARLPGLTPQDGKLGHGDAFLLWTDGLPEIEAPKYLARHSNEPAKRLASQIVHTLGKSHDDAGCIVFRWR